ncbi:hypothetical protein B0H17DRAFT_1191658 [Mycena rosella]|uniref:Uncharacterized protein n=1 Tax=Mycena rosella TaxID=1033263 RepID=A0AAD7GYZ0_MYCRO|nr:hypothetical protein B0H17DRAFT_1191658 [Mycena rosella]
MPSTKSRTIKKPKKRSHEQNLKLIEARAIANSGRRTEQTVLTTRNPNITTKKQVETTLKTTEKLLESTSKRLDASNQALLAVQKSLTTTTTHLIQTRASLALRNNTHLYNLLRVERRKTQRYRLAKLSLSIELKEGAVSLTIAERSLAFAITARDEALEVAVHARASLQRRQNDTDVQIAKYKRVLGESQKKIRSLQTKNLRSLRSRTKAAKKATTAAEVNQNRWELMKNGVYTAQAKGLMRVVEKAGCAQGKVGAVIHSIAKAAGLIVKGKMSRRTVQRALIEGGVAARIQISHEAAQADGLTLSTDATSLRDENYEGGFLMINKGPSHQMRLLSLTSTVSHTSEDQLENIKSQISSISELYKRSPLGRRSQLNFEISDFLRLLKGMNGDHAADMKKTVRLVQAWKDEVCRIMLGYEEFQRMGPAEILEIVREIQRKNLEEVGGEEWSKLSNTEKDTLSKSSMDTLVFCIGDVAFTQLSPEAKHEINLFFWAGCSMHKELNCCRSFNEGMMGYYDDNPDIEPPVLLANRDNDATIRLAEETGQSTAAVQRAPKVSERGGVKLISLFGALVNHKDDKKGLHDVYENYFRNEIGSSVRFPDTSNTRYQSHGLGGARIISHLDKHRQFMQFVKDHKTKRTLNHLEQNIVKGLYCLKTLAQIVLLVLFCMSLMHPYARRVRGEGTEKLNILDLGPFHASVKAHIQKLIENPDILLSSSEDSYKLATLDGLPWSDLKAWSECVKLAPTLPDLKPLLLAGLKRALFCWERFTSEFEAGGLID